MQPASLIGFAVLLAALCWASSAVLAAAVFLTRPPLRCVGPCAERVAAASVLALPPLLGFAVTLVLIGESLAGGAGDHCLAHGHHLHLCLYHGAGWGEVPWAVVTVIALAVLLAARFAERARSMRSARQARLTLERMAIPSRAGDSEVLVAPADSVFCFVAGVFQPRIFVSRAAWERLDDRERRAVLAHERAHISQGDVWCRYLLGLLATLGVPIVTARALEIWADATERLCDRRSARRVGAPTAVASAIVKLSQVEVGSPGTLFTSSFVSRGNIVDRVEAVLRDEPDGTRPARWIGALAFGLVACATLLCARHADPIHHAFETLLASI